MSGEVKRNAARDRRTQYLLEHLERASDRELRLVYSFAVHLIGRDNEQPSPPSGCEE